MVSIEDKDCIKDMMQETFLLSNLQKLIVHQNGKVREKVCWILSNLLAEDDQLKNEIVRNPIMKTVLNLIIHDNFEIKREGLFCVANALSSNNSQIIYDLIKMGVLDVIIRQL
jgi:hypothetical protein